ncbi:MAG TPA: PadR family transcriptional regulator [Anaerolineales bacterium]|nr:PadR family transcriptional regulator [Anaerolineae bacterium]HIP88093.1 PadR family transcriptional regulator [Anaerolineales bacterium]
MTRRRLPLEKVLLGFLMQGPLHGYDLHRRVETELGNVWRMGMGHIYNTLKELERGGHVESMVLPQENRPSRKVYRITPEGKRSFLTWVRQPVPAVRDMRVEFPAKLYFFHLLNLDGVFRLIAAQEAACRRRLERMEKNAKRYGRHDFNRLVFDFRRRQIEAVLDWLADCRETWATWRAAVQKGNAHESQVEWKAAPPS